MKTKHTKGTWQQQEFKSSVIVNDQDLVKQTIICQIHGNGEEMEANARLIAAAPELLEALLCVVNICDIETKNKIFGNIPNHWTNKVLNAIKKAQGE